ncbi:MAG: Spy/CpxP family protein refolding chaperone [Candidatus Omnitrophota bacterium]
MKRKSRKLIIGLMVIACFVLVQGVYAQEQTESRKEKIERFKERKQEMSQKIAEELVLTDEQQKALKEHRESFREETKALRDSLRTKQEALHAQLEKYDADQTVVNNLANEVKALQSQLVDQRVSSISEVKNILTPEQFDKLQSIEKKHKGGRQQMKERFKDKRQEWGHPGAKSSTDSEAEGL